MSRTLEPTLLSLIPTHSTALPPPLLELASSLLAQSRNSAGSLKQEEEVARSYACAHIACERLKISLDLPPIQPRPPIPPRIYNRLYTHLDNVLPASSVGKSGRVRTPNSKLREAGGLFTSRSAQRIPSRGTPSKDNSLAKYRSPAAKGEATPTKSTGKRPPQVPAKKKAGGVTSALPAWIRPTIQLLCKELDDERIGRTVLAGMMTIAAPNGRRTKDEWVNEHLTPLLAAIYFLVSSQLYVMEQGKDLDKKQYARLRKSILNVLEHAQEKVTVKGMDEDELWIGWADIGSKDVDDALTRVVGNGWQRDEWFAGIKNLVATDEPEEEAADVEMEDGDGRISEKLHRQRPDTMFQSKWDMTERKREEYRVWKEGILRQIEEVERRQEVGIEVDSTT
ncbi:Uu.00g076550.m01.CDS01 [Anthostomella pinea]|uniref:Uu.00g076550.m01.CDS01 n=1 Tax=Anthostomella pinea TaxID=933095 RepID=A0AAI8VWS6_9PEZI|nr:Uu.00g076550.m01.CDS01 [Anthostomella pinea]